MSQQLLPDGRMLLEARAGVQNLGEGLWTNVQVGFKAGCDSGVCYETLSTDLEIPGVSTTNTTLATSGGMYLRVSTANLTSARNELVSGSPLVLHTTDANGQRQTLNATARAQENVALVNPRVLAELPVADNHTLLIFAADVQNNGSNTWTELELAVDAVLATNEFSAASSTAVIPGQIAPLANASNSPPFYAAVASSEVTVAISNLFSGEALTRSGFELWVFNAPPPPGGIDQQTEDAWLAPGETSGGVTTLKFNQLTPFLSTLQPGDFLLEDPGVNLLDRPPPNPADPFHQTEPWLGQYVPLEVISVSLVGSEVHVTGQVRTLFQVLSSATFSQTTTFHAYDNPVRDPYDPTLESTYTLAEQAARSIVAEDIEQSDPRDGRLADLRGFNALPWHFNELQITDRIRLSGEVLLRSSGLKSRHGSAKPPFNTLLCIWTPASL